MKAWIDSIVLTLKANNMKPIWDIVLSKKLI